MGHLQGSMWVLPLHAIEKLPLPCTAIHGAMVSVSS